MQSTMYVLPGTGLTKHKMVRDLEIDSVPKLLFSKTFGYSESVTYMVLESLERLYKNPMIKPIMDVIAVRIIKSEETLKDFEAQLVPNLFVPQPLIKQMKHTLWDDFYIKLDPLLSNKDYGICQHARSELNTAVQISRSDTLLLENVVKISGDIIKIHLGHDVSHDPQGLDETLSHEMSHAAMEILFNNGFNGYNVPEQGKVSNQQRIFENCLRDLMEKVGYMVNPTLPFDLNSSLSGIELFRLFISEMRYVTSHDKKKTEGPEETCQEVKELVSFLDDILPIIGGYADDKIHSEVVARLFHVHTLSSTYLTTKVTKLFGPYIESLNKSIDQYMEQDAQYIPEYVHKNDDGSYGAPTYWKQDMTTSFDDDDGKLYMAIIKHEFKRAKSLLEKGADVSANPLVAPIVGVVAGKNDVEAAKFIADNVDYIDLLATNIRGDTIKEYLEKDSEAAHILHDKYMPQVHEHNKVVSTEGVLSIEGYEGFQDSLVSQQTAEEHNA